MVIACDQQESAEMLSVYASLLESVGFLSKLSSHPYQLVSNGRSSSRTESMAMAPFLGRTGGEGVIFPLEIWPTLTLVSLRRLFILGLTKATFWGTLYIFSSVL